MLLKDWENLWLLSRLKREAEFSSELRGLSINGGAFMKPISPVVAEMNLRRFDVRMIDNNSYAFAAN